MTTEPRQIGWLSVKAEYISLNSFASNISLGMWFLQNQPMKKPPQKTEQQVKNAEDKTSIVNAPKSGNPYSSVPITAKEIVNSASSIPSLQELLIIDVNDRIQWRSI